MHEGILSAIGSTPLVRLKRVFKEIDFQLYAKLENLNPAGSIKDRPAIYIIKQGIESGAILPDTVIVESSSGNMGLGLAQACSYYGLRLICVVDAKTTSQNLHLLKAYGAEIDVITEPDPVTGEFLQARLNRAQHLVQTIENSFWPNQYANLNNPAAHRQTMREIAEALDGKVDYLFGAASTCGTIRGCAEYARENDLATRVIGVDAIGSVIFGGKSARRLIPGHGAAVRPALYQPGIVDSSVQVSDLDAVVGCRRLAKYEAILAGGSSGAVIAAIDQMRDRIEPGATCVAILADRGERYLDTVYSDDWVEHHFGNVACLWQASAEEQVLEMAR